MFQSVILFAVRYGRIQLKNALSFYSYVLNTPTALDITLTLAICFLCSGIIFLAIVLHRTKKQKMIVIEENAEQVRIPTVVIMDFIEQILEQDPNLSDFEVSLYNKKTMLFIDIFLMFNTNVSIKHKTQQIREALKEQIRSVFELTKCKINFQLKGINAAAAQKEPIDNDAQDQNEETTSDKYTAAEINTEELQDESLSEEPQDKSIAEELPLRKNREPYKKRPWSLLYK